MNKFPYKIGSKIPIYTDYQTATNYEGEGILVEFVEDGLPFILEEEYPDSLQKVYNYKKFLIFLNGEFCIRKIPYLYTTGKCASYFDYDPLDDLVKDKFIEVNGKEIY